MIHEANSTRKALAALPEVWDAAATAVTETAGPAFAPDYARGYAEAMRSAAAQLRRVRFTDEQVLELARGLLAKHLHPSRLGHVPSAGEQAAVTQADLTLALYARRAKRQAQEEQQAAARTADVVQLPGTAPL